MTINEFAFTIIVGLAVLLALSLLTERPSNIENPFSEDGY